MDIDGDIILRDLEEEDCSKLAAYFSKEVYGVTTQLYTSYLKANKKGKSDTIVACIQGRIVGYATIVWKSTYESFEEEGIPEIKDLYVLEAYQNRGIGMKLMDELERRAFKYSDKCAVGVGLAEVYEPAQSLYAKRGYEPDGKGIFYISEEHMHDQLEVDDNQALMMIKKL